MKKILLGTLCLLLTFFTISCALLPKPSEKVFSEEDLSLTLDDSFSSLETTEQILSLVSERYGYAVTAHKDDFFMWEENESQDPPMSLEDYGRHCIEENELEASVTSQGDLPCYIYEKEINGTSFTYLAVLYMTEAAYWNIQFACRTKDFEKAKTDFLKYAQDVSFTATETAA